MAVDRRKAGINWNVTDEAGNLHTAMRDAVTIAVLIDIRDELMRLNALLHCHNFTGIPTTLKSIRHAMPVRRKAKK